MNNASANGTLGNSALAVILGSTGGNTGTLRYTGNTASSSKPISIASGGAGEIDVTTSGQTLTLSGAFDSSGGNFTKVGAGNLILSGASTIGATQNWNNNGAGTFTASAAVSGGANTLTLGGTGAGATSLTGGLSFSGAGGLVISKTAAALTNGTVINGGTINFAGTGGITINSAAGAVSLASASTLGAAQTWTNNSANNATTATGSFNISSTLDLGAHTLTLAGTGITYAAGVISGTGGLTVNSGRVWLAAAAAPAHTYSGATTLNGGITMFSGNLSANSNVVLNGGILESYWSGGFTSTQGAAAGQIQIIGGESGFSMNGATGSTFNIGAITWGSATFNPSKFVLNSQFSQNAAAITLSSAINLNGANRTIIANSGILGNATATISGVISNSTGTAGLIKEGAGRLILTGANTYNGNTTISQGDLTAAAPGSLPGFATAGRVSVASGATLTVRTNAAFTAGNIDSLRASGAFASGSGLGIDTNGAAFSYGSAITEAISVTKLGGNNLTLTGASTYTGRTILNSGGSVFVASLGNIADASSPLGTNSTIDFFNGDLTFNGTTVQSSDKIINIAQSTATLRAEGTGAGALTLSANITPTATAAKTLSLFGANTNANTISGVISNGAGGTALSLVKNLAGTWVLSGANTYTGTTTVSAGRLEVGMIANGGSDSSLGRATNAANQLLIANASTLRYVGSANATTDKAFTINGSAAGHNATIESSGAGTLSFSGGPALAYGTANQTRTLILGGTNTGANTFGKVIADNGTGATSFTKAGPGTWNLSNSNTYTGTTSVDAGKLVVSGVLGSTAVTVNNPGTVLATDAAASFGSTLAVNSGAILAPGDAASAGTATFAGAATFNNDSIFSWDINAAGTGYDKLVAPSLVDGNAAGGSTFRLVVADTTFANAFWNVDRTWTDIFTTNGTTPIANWANIFSTLSVVNSSFTALDTSAKGTFAASGNTLTWSAIPEPTSALAGLLLAAGLLRRRRN